MSRIFSRAWVAGAFIAIASAQSNAAGLGPLAVKSVLGEPLRAEVSVSALPAELPSLGVRLAPKSAYQAAGMVYSDVIPQLSVSLSKDAESGSVVSISSAGPMNEPVVDVLLELTWSSGRVTREYTLFIDPPSIAAERERQRQEAEARAARAAAAERGAETRAADVPDAPTPEPLPAEPVAEAEMVEEPESAATPAPAAPDVQRVAPGPVETLGGSEPTLLSEAPLEPGPSAAPMTDYGAGETVGVIRGDTLYRIAVNKKPSGVTVDQVLVVLFRNNPNAFAGNNMNRLRAGKVIRLPEREAYSSVTPAQAREEVRIQAADWDAYREQLAAAATQKPAEAEAPAQQAAAGAVTPKVEDRGAATAASGPEVVKLSTGEPAKPGEGAGAQSAARSLEEKLVASEKALKDANDRVARLEKMVADLQKLVEVKSQDLAQLQSQAAKPAGAPQPAAQAPAAPAAQPADAGSAQQAPAAPAASTKPATAPAAPPAAQAPAQQPAAPASQPAKPPAPAAQKPQRRPQPAPPPPSLLDRVMEQPYLAAVPLVVLLLVGFGVSRLRGRKREPKSGPEEVAPAAVVSGAAAAAAGEEEFSPTETNYGTAGSRGNGSEVDPLEEVEIFLAYGRDGQAEELLKEAIQAQPTRYEAHAKLLEIYAKRGDKDAFEALAREVQQGTGSEGEIWDRVVALGYSIDPDNPRYASGKDAAYQYAAEPEDTDSGLSTADRLDVDVELDEAGDGSSALDFDLSAADEFASSPVVDPEGTMDSVVNISDLRPQQDEPEEDVAGLTDSDLNVELPDLGGDSEVAALAEDDDTALEMDSGGEDAGEEPPEDVGLEFNLDGISLDEGSEETASEEEEAQSDGSSDMPALDLSGISLEFEGGESEPQEAAADKDEKWYEVQTKFDLAKAYQEMGDKDGAKEILEEVISEGDAEQKAAAESVIASL